MFENGAAHSLNDCQTLIASLSPLNTSPDVSIMELEIAIVK